MRGRSSFAILQSVGGFTLPTLLVLMLIFLADSARADDSVILEIEGNPALENAGKPPEEAKAEPPEPQELMIQDAINTRLDGAELKNGHHADDIAALTAFYKARTGPALWLNSTGFTPGGEAILEVVGKADSWGLDPLLFGVPPKDYRPSSAEDQAATELAISLAALKYARAARGGLTEPKSVNALFSQTPDVRAPNEVLEAIATASAPDTVLVELHPKHAQFKKLREALSKAKTEEEDLLLRRNMERWRWMPADMGETYVWLNIPEFMLHSVEKGKTVQSEKVLVGAKGSPTPVLTANMTEIVFNPERIVPSAIIRRDVLPKLQGAGSFFGGGSKTAILDQYGITVKRTGKAVDPKTIDWKKVNLSTLTFVQKPGRTNIMGKVQFLYPNDRKVFMRDTTLRGKFARDMRAEGAKDPRVANADKLAAQILATANGASSGTVRQQIAGGKTSRVKLKEPLPVHMTYFTAIVDDSGTVKTFDDVYSLDNSPKPAASGGGQAPSTQSAPSTSGQAPIPPRKPINGSLATTVR